ncbi:hypothetical protein R1flu_011307 [Riccia fluitans]|uniref:Uncharacterized protein n=1 Tax=Riccia fluitans TaxID=41844 RepID=A0ABD1Z7M7_9MARC
MRRRCAGDFGGVRRFEVSRREKLHETVTEWNGGITILIVPTNVDCVTAAALIASTTAKLFLPIASPRRSVVLVQPASEPLAIKS